MISDRSLHFGMQNFFFVKSDDTDGTYNYYGFMNKKGATLLMRTNKTLTESKYCVETGDFTTIFAARATKTYALPNELVDPNL